MKLNSEKGKKIGGRRNLCEVHREIYDAVTIALHDRREDLEKISSLIEEAFGMGIKVSNKLLEYNIRSRHIWEKNTKDKEEVRKIRDERIRLVGLLKDENEPI